MLRKKNHRDPIGSLELGGAVHMTSSFRVKRFSYKKILKYLVLIILGVAIHSIYREIFQAHHVEELQQNDTPVQDSIHLEEQNVLAPPDKQSPQEAPIQREPPGGRVIDNDNANRGFHHENSVEEKAKQIDNMGFKEHDNNMAQPNEIVHDPVEQNQLFKETNERIVDENEGLGNFRKEANEFPVEVDPGPFEKIVDLEEDVQENLSNIKAEEEIQREIANIMEDAYEDIKLEHPSEKHVQEALSHDDVIDVVPPKEIEKMKEAVNKVEALPLNYHEVVRPHDHGLPNLVTAALKKDVLKLEQLIISVQRFFPNEKMYIYDIDLEPRQHKLLAAMCNVRMRSLMVDVFPPFVKNITNFHWRPLVMHIAVTEFEHITWLNPNMCLKNAKKLLTQVPKAHDTSVFVIGQAAGYTSFAVTHPDMYKFITTDRKKLASVPHIEIYALIMHNTEELRENLMKPLLSCTMNPACLAPHGAGSNCDFDFSGRLYAKCHQYDESAINILLKNWFQFDKAKFMSGNCCFTNYNPNERIRPQICHRTRGEEIEDL
ncbi:uncharacterized protein LOC110464597 [Mizuhopecten yessoensis]|uniref:Uncharacterized protein n=1 Tax=Mizuhopecten yessoensis TaxID=6573 RepID=A0A210PTG6_MIZYE|nr:uncharacterized protein LOC110464597 [Mizuhopecten yessoensis]OWF39800.1 hypothetical protein KP79_PYT20137 [Mizuhopecten yessoensis]